MAVERVLGRRRAARDALLERAREFTSGIPPSLCVQAAVVIGSVARGDFNRWSDIDVIVIADRFTERVLDRLTALEPRPALVQPIPWTPAEWHEQLARRNPMAREALERGVWLVGSPDEL
jgi:uncharacterized protein